ncbi:MAG: protein phosphatase 2C domain-containing protein [Microscillaceae bacterium]|jgi:hypothetical protein|nr:protein phosphatase 2C domain-containing protein [Microscillaceae bacterium]
MKNWLIVGGSATGASHSKNGLPCQDAYTFRGLKSGWGVAVVSDGAGSASYADLASQVIVNEALTLFLAWIDKYTVTTKLPDYATWQDVTMQKFRLIKEYLAKYCQNQKIDLAQASATLMVLVFAPQGLLVSHIGDGRGAYQRASGEWQALFKPYKGEYANETVFLTSDIWTNPSQYIDCQVISEPYRAFALLTDGMERHSFVCNAWDEALQKYLDPNEPFANFFNPLVNHLQQMQKKGAKSSEIQEKWLKFLNEGNEKIKQEPDDKTMILGVRECVHS